MRTSRAATTVLPLLLIIAVQNAHEISGTVIRDVGRDGVNTAVVDSGAGGATVNVYDATNPNTACASGTTNNAGAFNFGPGTCSGQVRVEVLTTDSTTANSSTASNVQFAANVSATGLVIPVTGAADFCAAFADGQEVTLDADPFLLSSQIIAGVTGVGGDNVATRSAFKVPYSASNTTGTITTLATHGQTGATWGVAHQQTFDRGFFSAFQRRRSGFGSAGIGGIYMVANAATCGTAGFSACAAPTAVNIATIVGAVTGTDTHDTSVAAEDFTGVGTAADKIAVGAGAYTNTTAVDPANPYSQVGKIGWGTYFVEPTSTTIAHSLLLQPQGAAVVLGASSLTESSSDMALAQGLMNRSALSFGEALQQTQAEMQTQIPQALDVILGGALLGDPSLR